VEGSNTLTRGLIIFGQGLNKSHPYIFPIFTNIQEDDLVGFKKNFNAMVLDIGKNYVGLLNPLDFVKNSNDNVLERLERSTIKFSLLANYVALLGGKIKSKQMISGTMADILSNLYLGYSLVWYHHHYPAQSNFELRNQCLTMLLNEIDQSTNTIISNYPIGILKPLLLPLKCTITYGNFQDKNKLYERDD
jgi:acyl-CoA dehydrogenase